jgi:endonuclease-3
MPQSSTPEQPGPAGSAERAAEQAAAPRRAARPRRRESKAARAARVAELLRRLAERYPDPTTALHHGDAWELLVATILSAQSTDDTVNKVTPDVFRRWPTVADLAEASREDVERVIFPTGFFRNKAKSIQGAAEAIVERHDGEVPGTMEELVELPGVGRKTANVVLGSFFGRNDGVVVDTHVGRLVRRLGLTTNSDPVKTERDLMALIPQEEWTAFSHRLIWFGREVCKAKDPRCDVCPLADICPSAFTVGRWATPDPKKRAARSTAAARTARAGTTRTTRKT